VSDVTATAQSVASVEVAARFTSRTRLASWVVVRRRPGIVARAQSLADRLGLEVKVEIGAVTIALRFVLK